MRYMYYNNGLILKWLKKGNFLSKFKAVELIRWPQIIYPHSI